MFNIVKAAIKKFLIWGAQQANQELLYEIRADYLTQQTLTSTSLGISEDHYCNEDVIVSLTSYGSRLHDVYLSIESIMQGSMKPNKIVLWLSEEYRNKELPRTLLLQKKRGLEIEFCKDIRSYTKIIPCLKKYPNSTIITIDDDLIYKHDIVEKLVNAHKEDPLAIHANRIHLIKKKKNGSLDSYMNWAWGKGSNKNPLSLNFFTGVGGVLYPPHAFSDEVFNENVFLDICKYADDVWLYCMALLNNTPVKRVFTHSSKGEDYIVNKNVQETALLKRNSDGKYCENDTQLHAVIEKYDLMKLI